MPKRALIILVQSNNDHWWQKINFGKGQLLCVFFFIWSDPAPISTLEALIRAWLAQYLFQCKLHHSHFKEIVTMLIDGAMGHPYAPLRLIFSCFFASSHQSEQLRCMRSHEPEQQQGSFSEEQGTVWPPVHWPITHCAQLFYKVNQAWPDISRRINTAQALWLCLRWFQFLCSFFDK